MAIPKKQCLEIVEDVAVGGGFIALYTCIVCSQIQIIYTTFQGLLNYCIAQICVHTFRFKHLGLELDCNCKYKFADKKVKRCVV